VLARLMRGITGWARARRGPPPGRRTSAGARRRPHDARKVTAPEAPPPAPIEPSEAEERDALLQEARETLARNADGLIIDYENASHAADGVDLIRDVRSGRPGLIRQPPLAARAVMAVLRRRDYSLDEVTRLIERDPALAQTLLRHANSAWYATPGAAPVVAIGASIQRIGSSGVHATVMSSIIGGELSRPGAGYDELARQVWDHMVRVAPLARHLAHAFGADPEEAFTLGLAHDVGKLVLFDRIAELRRRRRRPVRLPDGLLTDMMATLHESLGGIAATEWGLTPRFARSIICHHRTPPPREPDPLCEVVHLAEYLDLAAQREEAPNLQRLWESSELTGSLETALEILADRAPQSPALPGPIIKS